MRFCVGHVVFVGLAFGEIGDACSFFGRFAMPRQRIKPLSERKRALKCVNISKGTAAAKIANQSLVPSYQSTVERLSEKVVLCALSQNVVVAVVTTWF